MVIIHSKYVEDTNIFKGDLKEIVDYLASKDIRVEVYEPTARIKIIRDRIGIGSDEIEYEINFDGNMLENFRLCEYQTQDYSSRIFIGISEFREIFVPFFDEYVKLQNQIDKLKSDQYNCRDIIGIKLRSDEDVDTYEDQWDEK